MKFTEKSGVNVRIKCRRESYGLNLIIVIRDTGIGMTDSRLTKMYDLFYQAHNFEALLKLQRSQKLTHVFIARADCARIRPSLR